MSEHREEKHKMKDVEAPVQGKVAAELVVVETPYSAPDPFRFVRNLQYMILCNYYANFLYGNTWVPQMCNTQFAFCGLSGYIGDMLGAMLLPFVPAEYARFDKDRATTLQSTNLVRQSPRIDRVVAFTDFGVSNGMKSGMDAARAAGKPITELKLPQELKRHVLGQSFVSTAVPLTVSGFIVGPWMYGVWKLARRVVLRGRA